MKNFKKEKITTPCGTQITRFTEVGFESASVVARETVVRGLATEEWWEVIPVEQVKPIVELALEGGPDVFNSMWECSWWVVPLRDGSYYPFPLLFSSQEEQNLKAVPSASEVENILQQLTHAVQ